ncbi:hypothetical protein D3C85_771630 [compost metagenome]
MSSCRLFIPVFIALPVFLKNCMRLIRKEKSFTTARITEKYCRVICLPELVFGILSVPCIRC